MNKHEDIDLHTDLREVLTMRHDTKWRWTGHLDTAVGFPTCTRISVLTRRDASCSPVAPREEHKLSISSMKIVAGAMARAISNKQRTMRSDSPLPSAASAAGVAELHDG